MADNKCLVCGSISFDELLHIDRFPILFGAVPLSRHGKVKKFPLTVAICKECSMIQQTNLLPSSVLDEVYTSDYYNCPPASENKVGQRVIHEFYSFFKKNAPVVKGQLLEIACFDGYLLGLLKKDGWDVYGCDPAGQTSAAVKNFGKDRIINDFFSKSKYPNKKFDVIVFRHLLEHIYDVHSFLDDVAAVLKDDGCVFIEVPNIYALFDCGGLGAFFHQHISHFSIETLQNLLHQHNFIIEKYDATTVLHVKVRKNKGKVPVKGNKAVKDMASKKSAFLRKYKNIEKGIKKVFSDPSIKKIALFGASAGTTTMVNMIDQEQRKKIGGIFDNDSSKHGKFIEGMDFPISSPEKMKIETFDIFIINSYIFFDEIQAQLIKLGVDKSKINSLGGLKQVS